MSKVMSISLQKLKKREPPKNDQKPPKKSSRFDGKSELEVAKNTLQDILKPNLDIVFVGINPSLMAAHTGRYYAGPGNHFYKLLFESKLVPEPITYEKDDELLQFDIGLTNIVARATRSSADLSKSEIKKGAMIIKDKLIKFKPKVAVFNGKCIYEEFADKYDKTTFRFGLQPSRVGDTALWVVPSSSARCANFPRMQDKLHFYTSLKKYLSYLKGEIKDIDLTELVFEGKCKQAVPSTSKMWRRKGVSAFTHGGRTANKETLSTDSAEESMLALAIPQSIEFVLKNSKNEDSEEPSSQIDCHELKDNSLDIEPSPKRSVRKRKLISNQVNKAVTPKKEYKQTVDFISLIKNKMDSKQKEDETQDTKYIKSEGKQRKKESNSTLNVNKALNFSNLKLRKRSFKVKVLEDFDDEI